MRVDPEAAIMHKCRELIMQLNVNLNHFPRHEKHGLCLQIRNCVYDVLSGLVECQKRYHNKTSLTKLDVRHEQLRTLVDSRLCFESYGCRKNKGTHRAADRAQQFLRESPPDSYLLQLDIRKFFYRIDREILLGQWRKIIKDERVLHLLHEFSLYPADAGVPIGNLMSQIAALIYLNPLDHYIKRELKASRYVRYVDDFIVFGLTKTEALAMRKQITEWLKANLGLELSRWTIQPVSRGLNFVGFRTWRKTRFVRKHSLYTFNRALRTGAMGSIVSCIGHAQRSASHKHFMKRLREYPELYDQLPTSLKGRS